MWASVTGGDGVQVANGNDATYDNFAPWAGCWGCVYYRVARRYVRGLVSVHRLFMGMCPSRRKVDQMADRHYRRHALDSLSRLVKARALTRRWWAVSTNP